MNAVVDSKIKNIFAPVSIILNPAWKAGIFICFEMPRRILQVYVDTQKAIFSLPLRCVNCIFRIITKRITSAPVSEPIVETKEKNTVAFLTGSSHDTVNIPSEMRKLTRECIAAVNRMDAYYARLKKYKTDLETWTIENARKNEEAFKTGSEEKELIKVVASAMKYLQTLKVRRENLDCIFCENAAKLFTAGSVAAKKLLDQNKFKLTETEARTNIRDTLIKIEKLGKFKSELQVEKPDSQTQVLNLTFEALHKAVQDVVDDNTNLKHKLTTTNRKLDEVIQISKSLNQEIVVLGNQFQDLHALNRQMSNLQDQLDRGKELLQEVEADRNEMRAKLQTLESMIKEEEDFLGDGDFETGFQGADSLSITVPTDVNKSSFS